MYKDFYNIKMLSSTSASKILLRSYYLLYMSISLCDLYY